MATKAKTTKKRKGGKKTPKYVTPEASRLDRSKVQRYGEELDRIERKHGEITPERVVAAAKPKGSVLHDVFTWDATKAARLYNLVEARNFIRWIDVELEYVGPRKPKTVKVEYTRAFRNVTDAKGVRKYVSIDTVKSNEEYRAQIIARVSREIERLSAELDMLKGLNRYVVRLRDTARKLRNEVA